MPPVLVDLMRRNFDPGYPSREFWAQWKNPGDVFSVLLILGGDVVARALAQLVGSGITPVAFSFGTFLLQIALDLFSTKLRSRMGCLCGLCSRVCSRREQAYAPSRHLL